MGLSVNTNIAAMDAYRNLTNTQTSLASSLQKLSSGLRINSAADDAAGLAISQGLTSQIGGLTVAGRNAQDGVSVVQTADGALTETQSILQRLRDLSVQAANDSNDATARTDISTEATSLVSELDRIGKSTNFNGTNLLDGTAATLNFQVGADGNANSQIKVNLANANVSAIATALGVGNSGAVFSLVDGAAGAGLVGLAQSFVVTDGTTTSTLSVALGAAVATHKVADIAAALNADSGFAAKMVASVTYTAAGVANGINVKALSGGVVTATIPQLTGYTGAVAGAGGALDFTSAATSQAAIGLVSAQITAVSTARAGLGAMQNRFQHTINNISVMTENLSASKSRITDTDMASEMVNFTRDQILSQAGTAMLAQANKIPQGVLTLLQ